MHARMGFDRREKNQITMASASAASAARMSPPLLLLLLLQANTNLPKWGPIFPPPALPRLAGLTNQQQESQAASLSLSPDSTVVRLLRRVAGAKEKK